MLLFAQEAMKYVAIRNQNSLPPCITSVQHSHAAKRLLRGLPDRKKKLSPNSLQKIAKISKNSPNVWKWLHLYQNVIFFIVNQSFKGLLSSALYFTRKRRDFQHFATIPT